MARNWQLLSQFSIGIFYAFSMTPQTGVDPCSAKLTFHNHDRRLGCPSSLKTRKKLRKTLDKTGTWKILSLLRKSFDGVILVNPLTKPGVLDLY